MKLKNEEKKKLVTICVIIFAIYLLAQKQPKDIKITALLYDKNGNLIDKKAIIPQSTFSMMAIGFHEIGTDLYESDIVDNINPAAASVQFDIIITNTGEVPFNVSYSLQNRREATLKSTLSYTQNIKDNTGRCLATSLSFTGGSCGGGKGDLYRANDLSWPFTTGADACGIQVRLGSITSTYGSSWVVGLGSSCEIKNIASVSTEVAGGNCADAQSSFADIFGLTSSTLYYITLSGFQCGVCIKDGPSDFSYVSIKEYTSCPYTGDILPNSNIGNVAPTAQFQFLTDIYPIDTPFNQENKMDMIFNAFYTSGDTSKSRQKKYVWRFKKECTPSWSCGPWGECHGGIQNRTCTDLNNCGTNEGKPIETQSCCSPNWNCTYWGECRAEKQNPDEWSKSPSTYWYNDPNWMSGGSWCGAPSTGNTAITEFSWNTPLGGTQMRTCTDLNNCGTNEGKPTESKSCTGRINKAEISVNADFNSCTNTNQKFSVPTSCIGTKTPFKFTQSDNGNGAASCWTDGKDKVYLHCWTGSGWTQIFDTNGQNVCDADITYNFTAEEININGCSDQGDIIECTGSLSCKSTSINECDIVVTKNISIHDATFSGSTPQEITIYSLGNILIENSPSLSFNGQPGTVSQGDGCGCTGCSGDHGSAGKPLSLKIISSSNTPTIEITNSKLGVYGGRGGNGEEVWASASCGGENHFGFTGGNGGNGGSATLSLSASSILVTSNSDIDIKGGNGGNGGKAGGGSVDRCTGGNGGNGGNAYLKINGSLQKTGSSIYLGPAGSGGSSGGTGDHCGAPGSNGGSSGGSGTCDYNTLIGCGEKP